MQTTIARETLSGDRQMSTSKEIDSLAASKIIGCSRAYFTDVISKKMDFPAPVVNISSRLRRWLESEVRAYSRGERFERRANRAATSADVSR
jgi:predicted DNA-binding transcriptional regulator AlpA